MREYIIRGRGHVNFGHGMNEQENNRSVQQTVPLAGGTRDRGREARSPPR